MKYIYIEHEIRDVHSTCLTEYLFSCYIPEIRMNDIYVEVVPPPVAMRGYYHPWITYVLQIRDYL